MPPTAEFFLGKKYPQACSHQCNRGRFRNRWWNVGASAEVSSRTPPAGTVRIRADGIISFTVEIYCKNIEVWDAVRAAELAPWGSHPRRIHGRYSSPQIGNYAAQEGIGLATNKIG